MKKKNIILFVADEMRHDSLHHAGNEASVTPNFDKILEDGVSFDNAYCQNPVCVPSRNSFLTGLYPHTLGHRTMYYLARDNEPSILKEMKNAGYEVIWIGRNDYLPADKLKSEYCNQFYDGIHDENLANKLAEPLKFNIPNIPDEVFNRDDFYSFYMGNCKKGEGFGRSDWKCIDKLLEILDNHKETDKPLFIYCTLFFPHPPYQCEEEYVNLIDKSLMPQRRPYSDSKPMLHHKLHKMQRVDRLSNDFIDTVRQTYLGMVSRLDSQFGSVVNKLKEKNMYDDTNIIMFSDHGDYTGDYGIMEKCQNSFEDPLVNVPLLIKPSTNFKLKNGHNKALVELVDIPATIADMAGIKLSYTQFGESLIHAIEGDEHHKDVIFSEGGRLIGESAKWGRVPGERSIYYPRNYCDSQEEPNCGKAILVRKGNYKLTIRLYEENELYDISKDPLEIHNLINDESMKPIIDDLTKEIAYFYLKTGDFVPNGLDKR